MEIAPEHWESEKNIKDIADSLEMILIECKAIEEKQIKEIQNKILNLILSTVKYMPRIINVEFFEGNKYIFVSDIRTFHPENFLKRKIEFIFPKYETIFSFYEITREERDRMEQTGIDSELKEWVSIPAMNRKFEICQNTFFNEN